MTFLDLLERKPPLLLHQIDEPEIPRAEHDDLAIGHVVLRLLLVLGATGRFAQRVADHRALLVTAGELGHRSVLERALDELVEAVSVPLLERRALRLTVVREDDDLVRPRRVTPGARDAAELLVELPQRLERVRALEPRMVCDLVVARERRIDDGPS